MNIRPRCREWLPLSTQQLRLRNLQAIQGVNIEVQTNDGDCSTSASLLGQANTFVYYTLHDHPNNEPFYQSEQVALRKHLNLKWAEIQCSEKLKSNANCVCVKVWASTKKTEIKEKSIIDQPVREDNQNSTMKTKQTKEPIR